MDPAYVTAQPFAGRRGLYSARQVERPAAQNGVGYAGLKIAKPPCPLQQLRMTTAAPAKSIGTENFWPALRINGDRSPVKSTGAFPDCVQPQADAHFDFAEHPASAATGTV